MTNLLRPIIAGFVVVIVLMLSITVMGGLQETAVDGDGDRIERQGALLGDDGQYVRLNNGAGTNETVWKTTGYAVNLTGAEDSYIQSKSSVDIASDDNWTVSVWGYVESGNANADMVATSLDGHAVISYNGSSNQWRGWYYDEGSRNSYTANVSTSGNEVGNMTNVMLWHNGSHLRIYRNNTLGETVATSGQSVQSAPVDATNWDGRLEELRTFNKPLNSSERTTVVSTPAEQMPGSGPTGRAMFDQPGESTQLLLYTDTKLQTSNVTYSAGFAEQQMQGDGNVVGGDYRWDDTGPAIAPIAGSELSGAPVAYASYTFSATGLTGVVDAWGSFTQIASMLPLFFMIITILAIVAKMN